MKVRCGFVGAALLASCGVANAATEVAIDINSLTAQFNGVGPFGVTSTGAIVLTVDTNSVLAGVEIDGTTQAILANALSGFSGQIDLVGGVVTGGFINITTVDGGYGAAVVGGTGVVSVQAGQGFKIDGLTFNGLFGSATFAGVDVSEWLGTPRKGSFLTFKFRPDENGTDSDSDIDLAVLVPMPMAAGMGAAGLLALGAIRRRR